MKAGGFIENGRVLGVLEPTRTIGDLLCLPSLVGVTFRLCGVFSPFPGDLDEKSRPGVVIPTPDVR
jgi:hypothetical protein